MFYSRSDDETYKLHTFPLFSIYHGFPCSLKPEDRLSITWYRQTDSVCRIFIFIGNPLGKTKAPSNDAFFKGEV